MDLRDGVGRTVFWGSAAVVFACAVVSIGVLDYEPKLALAAETLIVVEGVVAIES